MTHLHVTRMGMGALRGGMMTRTPECRQPRMAPPRASTMKLTKNLPWSQVLFYHPVETVTDGYSVSNSVCCWKIRGENWSTDDANNQNKMLVTKGGLYGEALQ